jgi:hypothetical protein
VLYDTSPPLTDYITSLANSKAKSPPPLDTYKPTLKEKTGLPPIQYSGVTESTSSVTDSSVYDTGSNGYDTGSNGYDTGSNGYDTGSNGYDTGSNGYDTGSNGYDTGSNGYDTGSNGFDTGSNGYDAGTNGYDAVTNGFDMGSNGYDTSNSYDSSYNMYIQPSESIEPKPFSIPMTEPTRFPNANTIVEAPEYSKPNPTPFIEPLNPVITVEPLNPVITVEPSSYQNQVIEPSSYPKPVTEVEPFSYQNPVTAVVSSSYQNPVTASEPSSYPNPVTEPISNPNAISTDSSSVYIDPTPIPEYKAEQGRDFDASLLQTSSKYTYDEEGPPSTEYYSSRRFEEFILNKGFLILEYFVQNKLCSFILLQLPYISESMMVYVNRKKYPIDVSNSSYPKTNIEKLKVDKLPEDKLDYENITLDGFDIQHSLDIMDDTNVQQKSLAYYLRRQLSRLMYITKNIEIKPCLIMGDLLGFHDIYHINDRPLSKEFFPVISLEILFSKTFVLEQNLPVFYKKFYSIVNQSNINKMNSLEDSLVKLVIKIKSVKSKLIQQMTLETDQTRVKNILFRLQIEEQHIMKEKEKPPMTYDPVGQSYTTKRLDQEKQTIELRRHECNQIYMEIKRAYDHFVFENEISFYELYNKIQDMEELIKYLE